MNNVFSIILIAGIGVFFVYQVIGLIRAFKERKTKKERFSEEISEDEQ